MDRSDEGALYELEQDWIAAEAEADHAKDLARRAEAAASELRKTPLKDRDEVQILIGQADDYARRRDEAEQMAAAAFDRFWMARGGEQQL